MRILKTLIFTAAMLFIACDDSGMTTAGFPPFVITKPVMEITERINHYTYAGIAFKFLNNSEEHIDGITVCFTLFDARAQGSAFTGNNKFEITKRDMISPGENREILISLDRYIYIAPTEPYLFEFFYISEIYYSDGRIWEDKQGKYRVEF